MGRMCVRWNGVTVVLAVLPVALLAGVMATTGCGGGAGERCYQQADLGVCEALCGQGKARACLKLGQERHLNGPRQDPDAAYRWFRKGCRLRGKLPRWRYTTRPPRDSERDAVAGACAMVGHYHESPPDRPGSGKTGKQGKPTAAPAPGRRAKGAPRAKDLLYAHIYRVHACRLGDPGACFEVGSSFKSRLGAPQDLRAAWRAYARACSLGYDNGCKIARILAPQVTAGTIR